MSARRDVLQPQIGENIARNTYSAFYPLAQTVPQSNSDLMHSRAHRANILAPQYTDGAGDGLGAGDWHAHPD